jgi:hypothetical protein
MAPTDPGYTTGIAALRTASGKWDSVSNVIGQAKGTAASLTLSDGQFSAIGSAVGLGSQYNTIHQMLNRFLTEGEYATNYVAVSLASSARVYEGDDQKAAGTMNSMARD